jgi:hypothetical protein
MKLSLVLLAVVGVSAAQASGGQRYKATTLAYHAQRLKVSEPRFGLAKVEKLIGQLYGPGVSDAVWRSLPVDEKFTYTMIHGEVFAQNCAGMPIFAGEEHLIFAYPPNMIDFGQPWSERQTAFLHAHRAAVIGYLRDTIQRSGWIGVNVKQAIIELNAKELIPDILKVYVRDRKDLDILSTCLVLMKNAGYSGLTKSPIYLPLYGKDAGYQARVSANAVNRDLAEHLAMAFFLGNKARKYHYYYMAPDRPPKK